MRQAYRLLLFLSILTFAHPRANAASHATTPLLQTPSHQSSPYRGIVVDSIVIENRNMFDTDTERYRHFIFKTANKLHYKTRRRVIKREVLFEVGEAFSPELAEETARNLRQRLPLYDAWIETDTLPNGHLLVRVVTIDEWTLSGGLNISRDGNETKYSLSLAERNLMGNNQSLSADYFVQPSDDNYLEARFKDRRFSGRPYAVAIGYGDDPLGGFRQVSIGRPFYNLLQRYSFNVSITSTGGRRDTYSGSQVVGQSKNEGDLTRLGGAYRMGSYLRKIQFSSQYVYRYERTFDKTITPAAMDAEDTLLAMADFPVDSLYHQVGVTIHLSNLDFIKLKWIDGFGYVEDFVLGQALQIGFARAMKSDFGGNVFDVVDIGFSQAYHSGPSLAFLTYNGLFWFQGGNDIRRVTMLSASYYHSPFRFLTIATRGVYLSDWRTNGAEAVMVGGNSDVRGFDKVFTTGDRKGVFNFEGRLNPNLELLSVLFGGVVFADLARSWQSNEPLSLRDIYVSAGVGLRIAFERTSKSKQLRIDFAYSQKNGWQLSIGTDQYFKAQASSFLLTTR